MNDNNKIASRRAVLRGGLAGGAAVLAGPSLPAAAQSNPANLPPHVADWSKMLGEGVAARTYGRPAKTEAHVVVAHVTGGGRMSAAATLRGSLPRRKARSASRRCTRSTASSRPTGSCSSATIPASPRSIPPTTG